MEKKRVEVAGVAVRGRGVGRDGGWRDLLVSRRWHEERRRRAC